MKRRRSEVRGRKSGTKRQKPVVLVIDVGGSKIKLRKSDSPHTVKFESGPKLTPSEMVVQAMLLTAKWEYDVVSIGFARPVVHEKPALDPENLGAGTTALLPCMRRSIICTTRSWPITPCSAAAMPRS